MSKRRGGRSSVGRGSLWPTTRQTARDVCLMVATMGGTVLGTSSVWVGLGLLSGAVVAWCGVLAYDRRWHRLQEELFRRRI